MPNGQSDENRLAEVMGCAVHVVQQIGNDEAGDTRYRQSAIRKGGIDGALALARKFLRGEPTRIAILVTGVS